jgi:AAA15 family ATPase/GTPase
MKDGFFKDITYVESPLYFHLMKALSRGIILQDLSDRRKSGVVPYHIQDLIDKLNNAHLNEIESGNRNIIDNLQIEKIIGGIFRYSDNKRTIVFKRYDGREFSPLNVASGIKSFGVLQLLAKGNYLTSDSLLIWDEPENHLHPEWQLEFAHVLVCLSAQGVPVLVTTHSPYFLQAIRYYAAEEEMSKFVNYYITVEREDQTIDLENVTCDLNRAFIKMAEPLNRIMNIVHKEVEEKIRKE